MSDIAISVENLSKSYLVGHNSAKAERYTTLRDVIANNARNLARKTRDMFQGKAIVQGDEVEEFWALKDLSFDIKQGDRVGIIGRNGAGKSTLLKILSRITEPTSGRIKINGRVASLLEVGTGFHPELTGRENIFLNGAILGMSRNEIQRKFDEIVAFAEVERFLDTPVKRYSSGMYVRLAFAVAAHLESEILIVDEVLAVGDADFQKKCLGKMEGISKGGRTVILVSHNMSAVKNLSTSVILLKNGHVEGIGSPEEMANSYLRISRDATSEISLINLNKPHISKVGLYNSVQEEVLAANSNDEAFIFFRIKTYSEKRLVFGFTIYNSEDVGLFSGITSDATEFISDTCKEFTIKIPIDLLNPGQYRLEGALSSNGVTIEQNECYCTFDVHRAGQFDFKNGKAKGFFRLSNDWNFKK